MDRGEKGRVTTLLACNLPEVDVHTGKPVEPSPQPLEQNTCLVESNELLTSTCNTLDMIRKLWANGKTTVIVRFQLWIRGKREG